MRNLFADYKYTVKREEIEMLLDNVLPTKMTGKMVDLPKISSELSVVQET